MAPRKPLRVVDPDEKPEPTPARRLSITEAAEKGTTLELLEAMRDRLAKAVEDPNCPPRDLAALTRRLQETVKEIEAIRARTAQDAEEGEATADEAWEAV